MERSTGLFRGGDAQQPAVYRLPLAKRGMSFKKPFRAVPVRISPAYAARQRGTARMTLALRIGGAFAIGLLAALAVQGRNEGQDMPLPDAVAAAAPIMMADPTVRERAMSAAELDAQQPSASAAVAAPRAERATAFRNCSAARAAGAAPLYRGQPGYGAHLDRDNDGIACEPFKGSR